MHLLDGLAYLSNGIEAQLHGRPERFQILLAEFLAHGIVPVLRSLLPCKLKLIGGITQVRGASE
ncbi:MAG: hypothetical protein ABGX16_23860 [Pirellulales bacterium]